MTPSLTTSHTLRQDSEVAGYLRQLIDEGARVRLPDLFGAPPRGVLYHQSERHGVSVVALPTSELRHEQ